MSFGPFPGSRDGPLCSGPSGETMSGGGFQQPAIGANGVDFGSDPTLGFDTRGNVFYGAKERDPCEFWRFDF